MLELMRPCNACLVGLFEECENPEDLGNGFIIPCIQRFEHIADTDPKRQGGGSGLKDSKEITDILSTGRKRAAMLLPIMQGQVCDWAGLKWAGGGVQPIVGCAGNRLAEVKNHDDLPVGIDSRGERHHGPDKAVLNNAVGRNLHAICSECHHRWHELNDPGYKRSRPAEAHLQWLPDSPYYDHDPVTRASEGDLESMIHWWSYDKQHRGDYPIELPPEERLKYPNDADMLSGDNPFEEPLNPFTESGE